MPFVRWLQQHTSSPPSAHPAGSNATGSSDQPNPRTSNPAGAAASLQHQHQLQHAGQPTLAQPPFASTRRPGARGGVQAAIADCRTENRLLEGYSARQELSVVLAVPGLGLPVNRAPTLTAKQVGVLRAVLRAAGGQNSWSPSFVGAASSCPKGLACDGLPGVPRVWPGWPALRVSQKCLGHQTSPCTLAGCVKPWG